MKYKIQVDKKIDHIGLDVDGVLADLQKYQLEKGNLYFSKKFEKKQENLICDEKAYDIQDIYDCTRKERMDFWKKYIWEYSLLIPAREGASDMTQKWHNEGRIVDIITSRVYVTRQDFLGLLFRTMLKIWLRKEKIYYDRIKFCSEEMSSYDKLVACKEYGTKIMCEDKIDNIETISKHIIIACFNANWNLNYDNPNMYRVSNFYEIDDLIQNLESLKVRRL